MLMLGKRKMPFRLLQYFSQVIWNSKGKKKMLEKR
jgi:hypothetical protein